MVFPPQRSLGVGGVQAEGCGRRRRRGRFEAQAWPRAPSSAWPGLTPWRGTPLTREHIRRSQAPQGPIDDPPTPLQGGQEGCLVLRHQVGYLNGGHDRDGGRASLPLSGQPGPPPPESSTWAELFCSSG